MSDQENEQYTLAEICHKALQLQGWNMEPKDLERIIATYQRVEKLGTAFSLKDAAEIEAKFSAKKEKQ